METVVLSQQEALESLSKRINQLELANAQLTEKVAELAVHPVQPPRGARAASAVRKLNEERLRELSTNGS